MCCPEVVCAGKILPPIKRLPFHRPVSEHLVKVGFRVDVLAVVDVSRASSSEPCPSRIPEEIGLTTEPQCCVGRAARVGGLGVLLISLPAALALMDGTRSDSCPKGSRGNAKGKF